MSKDEQLMFLSKITGGEKKKTNHQNKLLKQVRDALQDFFWRPAHFVKAVPHS